MLYFPPQIEDRVVEDPPPLEVVPPPAVDGVQMDKSGEMDPKTVGFCYLNFGYKN